MAEQTRQNFRAPEEDTPGESIDVRRLPHLISAAGGSVGPDRTALALEINQTLIAMRGPGHEEAESRILVTVLDGHQLDGLVDAQGRACRKEAVETLLACGFPHALKVSPEDLGFARAYRPPEDLDSAPPNLGWGHSLRRARGRGLIATGIGQALFLYLTFISTKPAGTFTGVAVLAGLLSVVVAFLFAVSKPTTDSQAGFATPLVMLAHVQAVCALALGAPAMLGPAGIGLGLLLCFARQHEPRADKPKPGDWDY